MGAVVKNLSKTKKMLMEINSLYAHHPSVPILIRHELDHILWGITNRSKKSRFDLESSAFEKQYDFTRSIFSKKDYEELKKIYAPKDIQKEEARLKELGVLVFTDEDVLFKVHYSSTHLSDPSIATLFRVYIENKFLNPFFLGLIEEALFMDKDEFIKHRLKYYQSTFFIEDALKIIKYSGGIFFFFLTVEWLNP